MKIEKWKNKKESKKFEKTFPSFIIVLLDNYNGLFYNSACTYYYFGH
jgi:uncharacterized protein Veg